MAVDMFLFFETGDALEGETQDQVYAEKKAIDVLAWSWGMSQSGTFHAGAGGGAGKANFQDISLTKWVDKSSPNLMFAVASGKHLAGATLVVRKAGTTPLEYIIIKMTQVMVTSLSTGGSGGEDRLTENICLNFAEVQVDYQPQKTDGSKEGGAVVFKWDIASNVKR
jgi:type VI secretion system secreted protein Hcp